jgi:hypothetical protein
MTPTADLSTWITKTEAAQTLGVSEKSIERMTTRGKLESAMRHQDGRRSCVVYNPADVAAMRAKLAAITKTEVLPKRVEAPAPTPAPTLAPSLAETLAHMATLAREHRPTSYVSPQDAVRITGLSVATIADQAAAGAIKTMPYGRGVRYRRADLEAL